MAKSKTYRIKQITLSLSILLSFFSFSQDDGNKKCKIEPFKVYIADKDEYSNIRESPKGNIVLKLSNEFSYGYILNVIGFKDGWLKINRISGIDEYEISEFEGWVHNSIVEAATTFNLDLFKEPNSKKKVSTLKGEQDTFTIINIYCNWIKIDCKGVTGWVESNKICGNPVTTCP